MREEILKISKTFFDKLWIELSFFDVLIEEENKFIIKIKTPDSDILIWEHWVIFENIQWILRTIFSNKYDKKINLKLKINNFKYNKDSKLFWMIDEKIKLCKETWENIKMPYLSGYDRKKVHSYIHKLWDSNIISKSKWEWNNRRMFIVLSGNIIPKKSLQTDSSLEIDIDWNDI